MQAVVILQRKMKLGRVKCKRLNRYRMKADKAAVVCVRGCEGESTVVLKIYAKFFGQ